MPVVLLFPMAFSLPKLIVRGTMAYAPSPHFWVTLFRTLLNTFVHSAGGDPLLAQAHAIWQNEPAHIDNLFLLVPVAFGIILDFLVSEETNGSP